jgi:hypothetical protein
MARQDRWADNDVLETFRKREYPAREIRSGMTLTHTASRTTGIVAEFSQGGQVVLTDRWGEEHSFQTLDGAFMHNGVRVAMREPAPARRVAPQFTASGSVETSESRARVARASRIWVEGVHDAELLEKIWGDDLRHAAVVVEPLHGADDLAAAVDGFRPGPTRRLGVLLDHLVEGSKESRIAREVRHPDVLICGHPYVDIWAAIKPATIGTAAWPDVEPGRPWKEGVIESLGMDVASGHFWAGVLDAVTSYRDIETPLVNAVEQLIDFVTVDS